MGLLDTLGFGGNLPNIVTGGLTDEPQWYPQNLDPTTQALIGQMGAEGNLTPQQIEAMLLQGTNAQMQAPATGGQVAVQQQTLGGPQDAAVTQALNDRANRLYASSYNQLQNAAAAQAPLTHARLQNQASGAYQAQQNVNDELNRQQMQVTLNQWSMRDKIIGQLFQGAGNAAGTYAGMNAGMGSQNAFNNQLQGQLQGMNQSFTSDPNSPYNLMGDPSSTNPAGSLGVDTSMDGNGYSGMTPPGSGQGYNGNMPIGGYQNTMPGTQSGYGLGISTNGLQ